MKTRLYRKFVKLVCKSLGISKKQFFARDYKCICHCYAFDIKTEIFKLDLNRLIVLSYRNPLSQLWDAYCFHKKWLLKYWRFSHWKPYIQTKIDLGENKKDAIIDIIQGKVR